MAVSPSARFDLEADVIVAGSGAAGFAAALTAQGGGADVVMLEKAATLGGTTIKSSGWAWYPNHRRLAAHDSKPAALRYMARLSAPADYHPADPQLGLPRWRYELLDAFYDAAADAAEALEVAGVPAQDLPEFPDYYSYLDEDEVKRGRTLRPATADGDVASAPEMIDYSAAALRDGGGRILLEHAVEDVIVDSDGRVIGVVARSGRRARSISARRGVIFATGGFGQSRSLRREHLAAPILGSCAAPGNTGDFLAIAGGLGAQMRNMNHAWMTLMALEKALENDPAAKSLFHPPGDSMLFVNRYGDRTLDEKAPYNETAQMLQRWDGRRAEYPDLFQVMVWDQACQDIHSNERPANPIRPAGESARQVLRGATLAELADQVRARFEALGPHIAQATVAEDFPQHLADSVARFNRFAADGVDRDFGRGETDIELAFNEMMSGPPRSATNPLMYPLSTDGPYYATIIVPAALDTKGGPVIDRQARVLNADGVPIPGLYGAGNCVASAAGKSYWAAGATIGPAVTFGYLAGMHATGHEAGATSAMVAGARDA